jgi:parallel beta-helix repeat protein
MTRKHIGKLFISIAFLFLLLISSNPGVSFQTDKIEENFGITYTQRDPILIETGSDFITEGFPGSGSLDDPYRIENYNITSLSESYGINISATSKYFVIQNCYIDCVDYGIWISWVSHGTAKIANNTIKNHKKFGLNIWDASGTIIHNNTVFRSSVGIQAENSDDLEIKGNNCTFNRKSGMVIRFGENSTIIDNYFFRNGIGLDIRFFRSANIYNNTLLKNFDYGVRAFNIFYSTFLLNTIKKNKDQGLIINYSENIEIHSNFILNNKNGIFSEGFSNSDIFNNTIYSNSNRGIRLHSSNTNLITYNRIRNNSAYGLYLNSSNNNAIHHNNFIDNNLGGLSQAYSSGNGNNTWFDTSRLKGNYWSNWFGGGYYQIEGSESSHDFYPLEEPVPIPRTLEEFEQNEFLILWVTIPPALFIFIVSLFCFTLNREESKRIKRKSVRETLDYVERKRKIAFADNVGTALFRFGKEGGNIVLEDLRDLDLNLELFIGYCYATIGLGQRYEIGVFGPLPAASLEKYNVILFAFRGLDDEPSDPRLEGKQYYLIAVIYPESQNRNLIRINTMNEKFKNYVKKFKYPNRMTLAEMNHFREIVFV